MDVNEHLNITQVEVDDVLCSPPRPRRSVRQVSSEVAPHSETFSQQIPQPKSTEGVHSKDGLQRSIPKPSLWIPSPSQTVMKQENCSQETGICPPLLTYSPCRHDGDGVKTVDGESSASLQGQLIDNTLENVLNLPQVVEGVMVLDKEQAGELKGNIVALENIKKKIVEATKMVTRAEDDNTRDTRTLYLIQEMIGKSERHNEHLKQKIQELITEQEDLKSKKRIEKLDMENETEEFRRATEAMDKVVKQAEDEESSLYVNEKLSEQKEIVGKLRQRKLQLINLGLTGRDTDASMKKELKKLCEEKTIAKQQLRNIEDEIQREEELQNTKIQDRKVLHKRNAAQMMRLKKQIKECATRQRQLDAQIQHCQQDIYQLKKQL